MTPVRIQRRRAKGWTMPLNTVCVDRSTKWGNPFRVGRRFTVAECINLHKALLVGGLVWVGGSLLSGPTIAEQKEYSKFVCTNIDELRGKNLACWCRENQPCHADVLLEAANQKQTERRCKHILDLGDYPKQCRKCMKMVCDGDSFLCGDRRQRKSQTDDLSEASMKEAGRMLRAEA